METPKRICRLCLKTCVDFKAVDDYMRDVLNVLLLKINLAISEEPVVCTNCAATMIKCFNFKTTCFYTQDYIVPFLEDKNVTKLDFKKVYVSRHKNIFDIPEDHSVCVLCMGLLKTCTAVSLDNKEGDVKLEELVKIYLPELDFSIINAPLICGPCQNSLHNCFHFMKACWTIEEKIQKHCEAKNINSRGRIELTDVQEYTSRNMLKRAEYSNMLDIVREYKTFRDDEENANDAVKNNNGSLMEVKEQKLNSAEQFLLNNAFICKEESNEDDTGGTIYLKKDVKIEHEDFGDLEDQILVKENESLVAGQLNNVQQFTSELEDKKCLIVEEIEIKTEQNQFESLQNKDSSPQPRVDNQLPSCCGSFAKECQCESCLYQTNCKKDVEAKSGVHKQALSNKNSSEITMYQCELCSLKTKYKKNLRMHMLTHKSPRKVTIYQCKSCAYEVKRKIDLAKHMWTHRDPSELDMYQCDICSFKTKYKGCYRSHMIIHNRHVELPMYQCAICPFKAINKGGLNRHLFFHKYSQK